MTEQETPQGEMPPAETPVTDAKPNPSPTDLAAELERTKLALKGANKEAAERRKRLEELEQAETKRKESEMSETDKLKKALAETETKLKQMERTSLQRAAAEKIGLPAVFANRLQGETPEELEADAKAILEALPKAQQPKGNPTNPGANATQGETDVQRLARIHGQSVNVFDPTQNAQMGGGVRFVTKEN